MEEEISFEDLGLDETTLAAVERKGFKVPSPIQVLAIPRLLNGDSNIIAKARTGTGKTAAFGLPIVQTIREPSDHVRALILEPTRELAVQTCTELQSFTTGQFPRVTVLYGGASYRDQIHDLKTGVEIVVGTPGRVQDHISRGTLKLDKIDYFILDEGDEMLDMGFVDDIEAIFAKANPASRILLFSATMPAPILKIAQKFMGEYEICEEEGVVDEPLLIDQKYWFVRESDKIEALVRLIDISPDFYGLVFTQTKNDADTVSRMLDEKGYDVAALHGDIPQGQREKILARFRSKKTRVLVATDVAARGIDISGLSHVVNFSLPFDGATYVHRIGRTGRAGATGCAVTFVRPEERRKLEYLKAAIKRAAKGEMSEGGVPTIEEVLEVKRARMLEELKEKIGLVKPAPVPAAESAENAEGKSDAAQSDNDEIIPMPEETKPASNEGADTAAAENDDAGKNADAAGSGDAVQNTDAGESTDADGADTDAAAEETDDLSAAMAVAVADAAPVPKLNKVSPLYEKMAAELCEGQNAQSVLANILAVTYGKSLDESHYGRLTAVKVFNTGNQLRLYVQMGRRDGVNPRAVAEYFSDLLHIPGRLVDRIDIAENFCLVSLPVDAAKKALELSKRGGDVPAMHIDSKSEGEEGGGRRGGHSFGGGRRGGFGGGDGAERGGHGFGRGGRSFGGAEHGGRGGYRGSRDSEGSSERSDGGAEHSSRGRGSRFGGSRFGESGHESSGERAGRYAVAKGDGDSRKRGGYHKDGASRGDGYKKSKARAGVHTPTERSAASSYKKSASADNEY